MSNVIEKHRKLVELLYQKTNEGQLDWNEDESDNSYMVSIGSSFLEINTTMDENDDPVVFIRVFRDGNIIERFTDNDIKGRRPSVAGYDTYYKLMSSLYDMAKRRHSGADVVLDDLIQKLQEK